jgi:putative tryptophan/tyrosine transport system substrate-binding protein
MQRREFIVTLGGAAVWPFAAHAQQRAAQAPGSAHIGFVSGLDKSAAVDFLNALRDGLAAHGYTEPSTLKIEERFADYKLDRIPSLVRELEQQRVDIIVTHAAATLPVATGQHQVPVVYELSADPPSSGLAADLAHPLHNATGVSLMLVEMNGKRLELLHEIAPQITRIAVIANPLHGGMQLERDDFEAKGKQLGIAVSFFPTPNRAELDQALNRLADESPQALVAFSDAFIVDNKNYVINFAMSRRLPVISGWAVMAETGALCTYGPRLIESYRRTAYFVDRILKGKTAAELPIERPTVFELVVNLNSAKTLGITMPTSVLVRADRVIE